MRLMLTSPAPFVRINCSKKAFDAESLTRFLITAHRGLNNPQGIPDPDLVDYQINEIVSYFLSLYE
jgi:hypothetical protein